MPLFISFEGPDGSGKSTQTRRLASALRRRGFPVTETREPGGTPLGDRIRELLLDPHSPPATPLTMTLLLSASRSQLVTEVILPAIRAGHIVIADRFADSTVAYQSFGLGVPRSAVERITEIATQGVRPDVRVYVDVPVEVGLERVAARGERNRLDEWEIAFHQRVRDGYRELIHENAEGWLQIDGADSPERVHAAIMRELTPFLENQAAAV